MNVMLTCAGRRNYLVSYFKQALSGQGNVLAADAQEGAPALAVADQAFVVPRIDDEKYVPTLLELCKVHEVRLLIPLNDLELPVISKHRTKFLDEGIVPVVASEDAIHTCFDKTCTYDFLTACGLPVLMFYQHLDEAHAGLRKGEVRFPLIIKPRWGTASIGIESAEDEKELGLGYEIVQRRIRRSIIREISSTDVERSILIQQCLDGTEYGLDIINDLRGDYVTTFVKRKLSMRAGETDRAITVHDLRLEKLGETLGRNLRHIGNLDVDVMVEGDKAYVLEMNPRFGGGYPFSHIAGANLPAALIAWAEGTKPDPAWFRVKAGLMAAKYDQLVLTRVLLS